MTSKRINLLPSQQHGLSQPPSSSTEESDVSGSNINNRRKPAQSPAPFCYASSTNRRPETCAVSSAVLLRQHPTNGRPEILRSLQRRFATPASNRGMTSDQTPYSRLKATIR